MFQYSQFKKDNNEMTHYMVRQKNFSACGMHVHIIILRYNPVFVKLHILLKSENVKNFDKLIAC